MVIWISHLSFIEIHISLIICFQILTPSSVIIVVFVAVVVVSAAAVVVAIVFVIASHSNARVLFFSFQLERICA